VRINDKILEREVAVRVLASDPEVTSSIPGITSFSDKQQVWKGVHSAS
jgi:hypothetical protein